MKRLESTVMGLQVDLGMQRWGMDSLAAPTIALTVIERRKPYFRDGIRGAAKLRLGHLVWAIESWDGMCEIKEGNHTDEHAHLTLIYSLC